MIDVAQILAETVRFEALDESGAVVRWGECSRWDLQFQAREGETVRELVVPDDSR